MSNYKIPAGPSVLITGGAGFLGSHLAEFFLNKNYQVTCVDNFSTGYKGNVTTFKEQFSKDQYQFIEADVVKEWTWANQLKSTPQYVFHMASPASPPLYQELPIETLWVNSIGLENALKFADTCSARVIFASTSEVYGDPQVSPQPETFWGYVNSFGLRSCYDEAKRFGEALIYSWNRQKKTKHGLVRIFNTYGPRMNPTDGRVVINFLVQGLKGQNLSVYGNGLQTRSFCYVDDLVDGIVRYANSDITFPVNLGNDKEFTVLELAHIVQNKLFSSNDLKIDFHDLPQDDPKQRRPDLTLAKKLLAPWTPKTELQMGLEKTLEWVKMVNGQ